MVARLGERLPDREQLALGRAVPLAELKGAVQGGTDRPLVRADYMERDMRTIRISDEVWQEIAQRGKFGETEDDVARPPTSPHHRGSRFSGLSSNPPVKKSDEVPETYYRPPIFRKEIRL